MTDAAHRCWIRKRNCCTRCTSLRWNFVPTQRLSFAAPAVVRDRIAPDRRNVRRNGAPETSCIVFKVGQCRVKRWNEQIEVGTAINHESSVLWINPGFRRNPVSETWNPSFMLNSSYLAHCEFRVARLILLMNYLQSFQAWKQQNFCHRVVSLNISLSGIHSCTTCSLISTAIVLERSSNGGKTVLFSFFFFCNTAVVISVATTTIQSWSVAL